MEFSIDDSVRRLFELIMATKPEAADVIVWLQGDQFDRGAKVLELYRAGFAPKILIIGNNVQVGIGSKAAEIDVDLPALKHWLVSHSIPESSIMVEDGALNVHEQAVHAIDLAKKYNWIKIILVASPYHQLRAFLTFLKARNDAQIELDIINQPATNLAWDQKPTGREKTAQEIFGQDELRKIKQYRGHVATAVEGLEYIKKR